MKHAGSINPARVSCCNSRYRVLVDHINGGLLLLDQGRWKHGEALVDNSLIDIKADEILRVEILNR